MKIFKSEKNLEAANKFVGFHVDDKTYEGLTLLAISLRVSKSSMLRGIVGDRVKDLEELIQDVASQVFVVWENIDKKPKGVFLLFRSNLREDLSNKGISKGTIDQIISKFQALSGF